MAEQVKHNDRELRGGAQGGEIGRTLDVHAHDEGTPGISSPAGGVRTEAPSRAASRTGLADRVLESGLLAAGKTPEMIRGYLAGVSFPAKKDEIVRLAHHNGAPEDLTESLRVLPGTEYASFEQLLRDYPRLPDENEVEPNKGRT